MATTTSASSSTQAHDLKSLIDAGAGYPDISAYLDALSSDERLAQMLSITGSRVGRLYAAVAGGPAVTVDDWFPPATSEGQTVILEGRNSLPAFSRFQKRFYRKGDVVVGYNHQTMSFVTGPGYFVATNGDATHPGELLFDYTLEPPFIPEGWPTYAPNSAGLSKLVYEHMKDYCRRVAKGVIIGEAFKKGKREGAFFSLTARLSRPQAPSSASHVWRTPMTKATKTKTVVEELVIDGAPILVIGYSVPRPAALSALTATEQEIIDLWRRGESMKAIAAQRRTAIRTVANQLASAYQKLGVGSRSELLAQLVCANDGEPEEPPEGVLSH